MEDLLKEFMKHMNHRFDKLENEIGGIKEDVADLKADVTTLKSDVDGLKADVATLKSDVVGLRGGQQRIEDAIQRIELSQPQDIMAILQRIDKNLENKNFEIGALNKRVFHVETAVERISNQS